MVFKKSETAENKIKGKMDLKRLSRMPQIKNKKIKEMQEGIKGVKENQTKKKCEGKNVSISNQRY